MGSLLAFFDLAGTFVFAISGAIAGVRNRLDIFGISVLAFSTGTLGGVMRDLFIGDSPPAAINQWGYAFTTSCATFLTFYGHRVIERIQNPILIFDAMGLALFTVTGTNKALSFGISPIMSALMGVLTGIGGGMARDILLARIPLVLHAELYATAALTGSVAVVLGDWLSLPSELSAFIAIGLCFSIRFLALRRNWRLPTPKYRG